MYASINSRSTQDGVPCFFAFRWKASRVRVSTRTVRLSVFRSFIVNFRLPPYPSCATFVKHEISRERLRVLKLVSDYLSHGWALVPIPPYTKGPRATGWNTRGGLLFRADDLPAGYGVGLAHAYSGTMAIDIDQWEATVDYGIDLERLHAASDSVTIESGRSDHGKLLYTMPSGLILPSVQFYVNDKAAFNFRCATKEGLTVQDVLPPTIHPDTREPYKWSGNGHWSRLPMIPMELVDIWLRLLDKPQTILNHDDIPESWDEIQRALSFINPDCNRTDWITIGMALHYTGLKTDRVNEAFHVWNDWSMGSSVKYPGEREIMVQWRSFGDCKNPVTVGSLFHLAAQCGWVRPLPDVRELFTHTSPVAPDTVLRSLRPEPPDLDLRLFPEVLRVRAHEVGDSVGCDPIVPLFAGLAAVCGVVDARIRLELMPGFKVPPVLWLMTIGDPADKKSPGSRPMLETLRDIEIEDLPRYKQELLEWEAKEIVYAAAKKTMLEFAGSPEFLLGEPLPSVPDLPSPPVAVRITVNDITSQKLIRHASDRPRGLLCHLDEMASWCRKLTDKMSGEDRSAWTISYESESYTMDRVGSGSIHCENLAVAIYGNIQPRVFREHMHALSQDGLLQRFIPAVLRHDQTRLGHPIPEFISHKAQWDNVLRFTFALPVTTYRLSPDAFTQYRRFQEWYESSKHDQRLLGMSDYFMTAFGKLEGLTGRLILLFHILESPFNAEVSPDIVDRVIRFVRGYIIPAYRYALGEIGGSDSLDSWLTDHIIRIADQEKVRLRELQVAAKKYLANQPNWQAWNAIISGMESLERVHWVARSDDKKDERNGRAEWLINPNLRRMFDTYRQRIIEARKRQANED